MYFIIVAIDILPNHEIISYQGFIQIEGISPNLNTLAFLPKH